MKKSFMENFIICVVFTIKINPPEFLDAKFFDNEIYETKLFCKSSKLQNNWLAKISKR